MRSLMGTVLIAVGLACSAASAWAQNAAPPSSRGSRSASALVAHRTGSFDAVLPDRSRESEPGRWTERFQFRGDVRPWDYDLGTRSFSMYVPDAYTPDGEAYGALVWLSPSDDGEIPQGLRRALDERHLIWIAPNDAGNDRHIFLRAGLALDAALNIQRAYHIDRDRVFVSGLSGGGRMAAMMAIDYPDIFAGGFPIIGVTSYQSIPLESDPAVFVPRFPTPSLSLLDRARRQPFVIMTGSGDFNREECRLTADAYARDGFKDLHFLDIDGMGHEMPSVESFARGVDLLLASSG